MKTNDKSKSKIAVIYTAVFVVAVLLLVLSFTVLANTQWVGGVTISVGIYLLLGVIIKLCKANENFKNMAIFAIDLLFFLP